MPSETMDFNGLSPSLYSSRDIFSSTERQAGFWKSDNLPKCYDSDQGIKPNLNVQEVANSSDSSDANIIATQHECSLFSSSLSELFSRKLRLSANNALYGHSVDNVASHYEEERLFDSLEELEAQIIGNLLPSEDDLLSGVTDDHGHITQDSAGDDMDELDLFSSVGGMELGDDDNSSSGLKNSEIFGGAFNSKLGLCNSSIADEHPTRTLFVRNINSFQKSQSGNSKSMIQQIPSELEQKECNLYLHQKSPLVKSPTSFPGLHGVIKSGSMDGGRNLGVEPTICAPSTNTAFSHEVSSSVPNSLPSLVRLKSVRNQCEIAEPGSPGQLNFGIQAASAFHPHSYPEYHGGLANGVRRNPPVAANINLNTQERIDNMQFSPANSSGGFMGFNECALRSSGNGSSPLPAHHFKWSNSCQPHGMMWPNSPSYLDGNRVAAALPRLHALPRSPSHMMNTVLPINNQHLPSASLWDKRHAYAAESPEPSAFYSGSLGNMRFSSNTAAYCVDFVPHDVFPHFGGSLIDLQILPKNHGLHFHDQRDLIFPGSNYMINSFDTYKQRARSRRNSVSSLADMKQYDLDIDRIRRGEDTRTTLMIKNIPNKYTSKMLLAAIDEHHKGTYDFVYLPIDFKNKCNVGYAFINMTSPSLIIPFYQVFNGKKWEKFNSEKVASLAYARIQGRAALIAHFQNSSLMNEDKRCRPILFNADGPNAGDQVPFPMGVNVRNKLGRARNNIHEDNLQGRPSNF